MSLWPEQTRVSLTRREVLRLGSALLAMLALPSCQVQDTAPEEVSVPNTIEATAELSAGAYAGVITPELGEKPVWLAGFNNNRPATGVHDDLWVRVLALSVGGKRWALAACDLVGLVRADILAIRELLQERGALPDSLIVCCTHTHSGPDTLGLWGRNYISSGINKTYQTRLCGQIADAIEQAQRHMQPARLRAGIGQVERWVRNARNPGLLDTNMPCLVAETPSGTPIATLTNIACHPEVLQGGNTLITSDFPNYLRAKLERDGWGTAIHTSADLGGMLTPDVPERTFEYAQRMGEDWATQVEAVLDSAPVVEANGIQHVESQLIFPLDNPLFATARRLGIIHPRIAEGVKPLSVDTIVSLTRLGPLTFLACPGEALPKLGLELRSFLPGKAAFFIGLANDELGYIIPEEDFHRPKNYMDPQDSYEESMSVGPQFAPRLREAVQALVEKAS